MMLNFVQWLVEAARPADLDSLVADLRRRHPGLRLSAVLRDEDRIELEDIVVPETERGAGIGTAVVQELCRFADQHGLLIILRPAKTTARAQRRLVIWYKTLGFVENKGRNKDYALSAPFSLTMYRPPSGGNLLAWYRRWDQRMAH